MKWGKKGKKRKKKTRKMCKMQSIKVVAKIVTLKRHQRNNGKILGGITSMRRTPRGGTCQTRLLRAEYN